MKCWHLVAAFALGACGLNTTALPSTGRSAEDAGVSSVDASGDRSVAGSPANWPVRPRSSQLEQDGGSSDTKDAAKPNSGPVPSDKDAQTDAATGSASPGGSANPSGPPASVSSTPGSQAQPTGSSSGNGQNGNGQNNGQNGSGQNGDGQNGDGQNNGQNNGQNGNGQNGNGSSTSGVVQDAGAPEDTPGTDDDSSSDEDSWSDEDDDHGSSGGQAEQPSNSDDAVGVIVELVLAVLDLSLGPVRPAEIEALVSSILVLSLAPADLAAESLVAVLDALEDTQICIDHPERCNPLCTNLESDCSACGNDKDCIKRIEEMCRVKLPKTCL